MGLGELRNRVQARFRAERDARPWLDHLVRAATRYQDNQGNHFAAGLTYFSFLALFPLILLALSVSGFVLARREDLLDDLRNEITDAMPGTIGENVVDAVNGAIDARGTVGLVGLLVLLYAGLGWVSNLRTAVQVIWGVTDDVAFLKKKLADLVVLAGLGLAIAVSFALTLSGTALTGFVLDGTGLDRVWGAGVFARILGLLFAMVGDWIVFCWIFVRLPRRQVAYFSVAKGALLGAAGFGVLKVVGTVYAQSVARSPTAGIFGTAIGLLVWINLAARFMLYAAAWTSLDEPQPAGEPEAADAEPAEDVSEPAGAQPAQGHRGTGGDDE